MDGELNLYQLQQAGTGDFETYAAIVDGLETVTRLIARFRVFEEIYLPRDTAANDQLKASLTRLYSRVLIYLSECARYYERSTGGMHIHFFLLC